MRLLRWLGAVMVTGLLASVAILAREEAPISSRMTDAANAFLASLNDDLRAKAVKPFDDNRFGWHFIPLQDKDRQPTRQGVRFEEMTDKQREAALALLRTGTSAAGYTQATTIISLESVLADLEKRGAMVRNPGWYFVTIFGKPSRTGAWAWRFEGHHLSLNFTLDQGEIISATPAFFGANPAEVLTGPKKGTKAILDVDTLARQLYRSLDEQQQRKARQPKPLPEVEPTKAAKVGPPIGLPAADMTEPQKATLRQLLEAYIQRFPKDVAERERKTVEAGGFDKIHFAWHGGTESGQPRTYRIQGPNFVVEFLNEQADASGNPANHIHSAWRRLPSDFGLSPPQREP